MQNFTFEYLKITAFPQTPVISDKYLPFDGILYNTFVRDANEREYINKPRQSSLLPDTFVLPIERVETDAEHWYYKASFAAWAVGTRRGTHNYAKRFDTHLAVDYADFGKKKAKVDTSRGEFKNYFVKEYTFETPSVSWYVKGDRKALEMLLPFCTHIGKKTAQGCGSVLRWAVESVEAEVFEAHFKRLVPDAKGSILYAIRPPYWLTEPTQCRFL